jgi:hypothetical protein
MGGHLGASECLQVGWGHFEGHVAQAMEGQQFICEVVQVRLLGYCLGCAEGMLFRTDRFICSILPHRVT